MSGCSCEYNAAAFTGIGEGTAAGITYFYCTSTPESQPNTSVSVYLNPCRLGVALTPYLQESAASEQDTNFGINTETDKAKVSVLPLP